MRRALIAATMLVIGTVLIVPLGFIIAQAFSQGLGAYTSAITDVETRSAIRLTLWVAAIAVPINLVFGVAAAWVVTKFDFPGKTVLVTLIDLPFAVSPVIAGMMFVLLFGQQRALGRWFLAHDIKIIFAAPGMALATIFITLPFVARELIPVMQAQGTDEEEAAIMLGANGWQTFWRVTLPNVKWGLLYGGVLSTARAVGEFGAVSVVSGHIRGDTVTLPLHVEILYNDYDASEAFAVASLLMIVPLVTLATEYLIRRRKR